MNLIIIPPIKLERDILKIKNDRDSNKQIE